MGSRPERVTGHTGIEIRPRLLREAAVENLRDLAKARASDAACGKKALWVVNHCQGGRIAGSIIRCPFDVTSRGSSG